MARSKSGRQASESSKRAEFIKRGALVYGVRESEVPALLGVSRKQSVRLNRLAPRPVEAIRADLERLCEVEVIDWCPDAFYLHEGKGALVDSDLFRNGEVYIQNASSLVPALCLDPRPGELVLDLAAAPGGKATHIAARMGNSGLLVANEPQRRRVAALVGNLERCGVHNAAVTRAGGTILARSFHNCFDRVLLQAKESLK